MKRLNSSLLCFGIRGCSICGKCARCMAGKLIEIDVIIFDIYKPDKDSDTTSCPYFTKSLVDK